MGFAQFPHVYVRSDLSLDEALKRCTHLAIGAHPDDLEIMAVHGILQCYERQDRLFVGIVCTDGGLATKSGLYKNVSEAQMVRLRLHEQLRAAKIGKYGAIIQLGLNERFLQQGKFRNLVNQLSEWLKNTQPKVLYTHNPADKHPHHVAVMKATILALRKLKKFHNETMILGCEVWRDLDWLADDQKVVLDVGSHPQLAKKLLRVFKSQIGAEKKYDLATLGRRIANATYYDPLSKDHIHYVTFAMDLTPLLKQSRLNIEAFLKKHIRKFEIDVLGELARLREEK